jgi:bifunctional oligoribonuclease and PAP phosphatase NrnA
MTISGMAALLMQGDNYIITSHESPDADGLGAEYALSRALVSMGKRVRVINAERHSDSYDFIDRAKIVECYPTATVDAAWLATCTVIILDTNDVEYTGVMAGEIITKAADVLVIDHHDVKGTTNHKFCLIPSFSSTCEMTYRILSEMGCEIPEDSASALFAGMVFDTGSFAYSKTSAGTFEVALELVTRGAKPSYIHGALYESSSTSVLLLRKEILSTLELCAGDKVAIQTMTADVLVRTGSAYQDAEGLINVPLQAASVEVSIFFKENEEGTLRCSLRSKGHVNVASIAQSFGGGGHKSAAGFKAPHDLARTKSAVLELVTAKLAGS